MENDKIVPFNGVVTEWKPTESSSLITGLPTSQELMVYETWAKNASDSQMYRNIGKESAIMMIMLAAREYGIGPAQALNGGLHIIEGKVELSARVMSALIRRARHELKIEETTDQKCTIWGKRSDTGEELRITYTIEMAQKAGLIKDKGGWRRTPEDMLYARCISRLARQLFSDVIGIGYVEGEISSLKASNEEYAPPKEYHIGDLMKISPESPSITSQYLDDVCFAFKWDRQTALQEIFKNPPDNIASRITLYRKTKHEKNIPTIDVPVTGL